MKLALPSSSTCKHVTRSISPDTEEPHSTLPISGKGTVGLFRALWVSSYLEALYVALGAYSNPGTGC